VRGKKIAKSFLEAFLGPIFVPSANTRSPAVAEDIIGLAIHAACGYTQELRIPWKAIGQNQTAIHFACGQNQTPIHFACAFSEFASLIFGFRECRCLILGRNSQTELHSLRVGCDPAIRRVLPIQTLVLLFNAVGDEGIPFVAEIESPQRDLRVSEKTPATDTGLKAARL
jgi:hypothetical protein